MKSITLVLSGLTIGLALLIPVNMGWVKILNRDVQDAKAHTFIHAFGLGFEYGRNTTDPRKEVMWPHYYEYLDMTPPKD